MTMSTEAPLGEVTVTQRLLAVAPSRGEHRALVGGSPGLACGYADLAATVQAAAAGLAWRGLQPSDVVGVYVPDAACYVLAAHAVRAAGGVPTPVAPVLTVPEMAGQLADCGARMLLTAPPFAAAALAAADRSWVRQVISFGEAPGATQFGPLLRMGTLRPATGRPHDPALLPYARQPDGMLGPAPLSHHDMSGLLTQAGHRGGHPRRTTWSSRPRRPGTGGATPPCSTTRCSAAPPRGGRCPRSSPRRPRCITAPR